MREILFRAKAKHNNEWVYGDLNQHKTGKKFIKCGSATQSYEVIPETVGQYTDLTDNNGTKIFEGDIVKCTDTNNGFEFKAIVIFGNPNCEYNWGFQLHQISGEKANTDILLWVEMEETGAFIDVIGNIYDKTKLIKG